MAADHSAGDNSSASSACSAKFAARRGIRSLCRGALGTDSESFPPISRKWNKFRSMAAYKCLAGFLKLSLWQSRVLPPKLTGCFRVAHRDAFLYMATFVTENSIHQHPFSFARQRGLPHSCALSVRDVPGAI